MPSLKQEKKNTKEGYVTFLAWIRQNLKDEPANNPYLLLAIPSDLSNLSL